jgi:acetolactate synthase-1/2/3 large subunit
VRSVRLFDPRFDTDVYDEYNALIAFFQEDQMSVAVAESSLRSAQRNRPRVGADIIADLLANRGINYLFGLCGHGILGLIDSILDYRGTLRPVSVHHESVAPFMADAYFRVSHKPAATFTSCGPGSVNLHVGVASAQADASAMLVITGNVATSQWNKGTFQESAQYFQGDFVTSLRPYVKRSFQPTRVDMLEAAFEHAFTVMESGRPGPVHIDIPLNVFQEFEASVGEREAPRAFQTRSRPAADQPVVLEALKLLQEAQRPLIVAGHGIQLADAETELLRLAELLQIPVVTSPMGKDVFDSLHQLSAGPNGRNGNYPANAASRNADVILALGTRFDDRSSSAWIDGYTYSIPGNTKLIHVDSDPGQIGKNYPAALGIVADVKIFMTQLLAAAQGTFTATEAHRGWRARLAGWKDRWQQHIGVHRLSDAVPIRPERLIHELRRALPADGILVSDVGLHHNWLISEFDTRRPRTLLHSWGFGSMGFGVAGGLGAKLAASDRPVAVMCGDGGFLMLPSAVATAVEYNIPVVWIIWNNIGYVSIRDQQVAHFGKDREIVTSFRCETDQSLLSTNFAMMARSMGAEGFTVERPQDLAGRIEAAINCNRPTVLDVRVDREAKLTATGSWQLPPLAPAKPTFGWQEDDL